MAPIGSPAPGRRNMPVVVAVVVLALAALGVAFVWPG